MHTLERDALPAYPKRMLTDGRPRTVMKFGGTSVADLDRIRNVAAKVAAQHAAGHHVAVVVSAMAGVTNRLVADVTALHALYDPAEYDAVVASGEQITAGLTATALQALGLDARSYAAHQVPIETDAAHGAARIMKVGAEAIEAGFARGQIAVVAGFQGVDPRSGRVTTLGRGGSDTSAAALAAALGAVCDIYTDVDGVYTTDPRMVPTARRLQTLTYEEMLEYASSGAKVLHPRSVELCMAHRVPLRVLSSLHADPGGTLITQEEATMEKDPVTGIACARNEVKITLTGLPDRPGIAAAVFGPPADAGINVDMIVQNMGADGRADISFTVSEADRTRTVHLLTERQADIGFAALIVRESLAKVSTVGAGMRSHPGTAARMFAVLGQIGVNAHVISTSEIKISVLIDDAQAENAVRALHEAFC